ncbi:RING zinc finger-containing protein [Heterostelium album PN500]|uniref:Peroxisome assembly protein 12 n=1 Tax=Heterostelium pallidum (strain ATCC 26659 / Pp 5 / PN500) TaxID=670386 RepID=D3B863_HETP5|nr:RING zinc finger-containing protein [Heterostelium album PN500]EFA82231.1 RING zinc finger-containing protein [Heterostelium album PN500]|eukprot:XP_020434348.1 RING zinc finger-containing protein [Heterostelium album PN500]
MTLMFLFNFNNGDPNRPSFFEMFAQHQMMPSFKPALKYIFTVLSQRNSKFEIIVKYHDEFFYSMLLLLEYHYLKYYEGSFSENFYNLKRSVKVSKKNEPILQRLWDPSTADLQTNQTPAPTPKKDESTVKQLRRQTLLNLISKGSKEKETKPMTAKDQRISILYLVILPYIKTKLDEFYKKESDPINSLGLLNEDNIYPTISALYEASFFIYQLLYLYEYTDFYTPFLHLQRIVLKRLTHQDIENHSNAVTTRRNERLAIVRNWPLPYIVTPIVKILDSILDYTKFILPASVFLFKSLEWWYSENRASPPSLPVPPPPSQPKRAPNGLAIPDDKTQCPLCLKERTNPTICGSGFVFCYPCIFSYVQQHQKCPITFIPATTEHLRKIYETT